MGHKFTRRRQRGGFWLLDLFTGKKAEVPAPVAQGVAQGAATGVEPIGEQQQQQALTQQPLGQQAPVVATSGGRKSRKRRHRKLRKSRKGKKR